MEETVEKDPNVRNREIKILRLSRGTECMPCTTIRRATESMWLNWKGSNGQKIKQHTWD